MIPVALFGIDAEQCEKFFAELPALLLDAGVNDGTYEAMLYKIEGDLRIEHLEIIDEYNGTKPCAWPEEVVMEILAALDNTNYPTVSLLEGLMTLDDIDSLRLSYWLHFTTNIYPLYDERACAGLEKLGLSCPFIPADIASYGVYVELIEGMKEHAPAGALPEYALPRQRLLQLGLAAWSEI